MQRQHMFDQGATRGSRAGKLAMATTTAAMLALHGCSADAPDEAQVQAAATEDGSSTPISQLPFVESNTATKLLGEALPRPTALGETTALHVRLPPPTNRELEKSLVRIVGPVDKPQILFKSDALARLGVIARSPGRDFFTAFATLPPEQLDLLARNQEEIASGRFGEVTDQSVLFEGRSPIGRTINPRIDPGIFKPGNGPVAINRCLFKPISTQKAWDQALFLRSTDIVQDKDRTWDPCTGKGTKGGLWTFAHLVREMATGSGKTPEAFVTDWLAMWLNDYVVNGDNVQARPAMFNQVIQPWATASGVVATMTIDASGHRTLTLSGPLDLNIAPFRLLAIVNRIDLGATVTGPSGYSGTVTSLPTTPGELRFIFGVVQPSPGGNTEATCGRKRFTTIFEYGVPGEGCDVVVDWAKQWTQLQAMPGFTPAYKAQLEAMTESVVKHGAAPAKGNQNAINQIRTNEIALAGPWELREFTLSVEKPAANTDTPVSGGLRKHTVAQTPDDFTYNAFGPDPAINAFVNGPVLAGVQLPVSNPNKCSASYTVPFLFAGKPFRGGNAQIGPGHWEANTITLASPAANICARHQFSLNTCGGCHFDDSGTNGTGGSTSFTHIDPLSSPPVTMSKFLTGGGPGSFITVNDTQLGAPAWPFMDLQRRLERLFELSHCTSCALVAGFDPGIIAEIQQFGPVPIDPGPLAEFPFEIGPVTDLGVVQKIMDLRGKFAGEPASQTVDSIHAIESFAE